MQRQPLKPDVKIVLDTKHLPDVKNGKTNMGWDSIECDLLSSSSVRGLVLKAINSNYQDTDFPSTRHDLEFANSSGESVNMQCFTRGMLPLYVDDLKKLQATGG